MVEDTIVRTRVAFVTYNSVGWGSRRVRSGWHNLGHGRKALVLQRPTRGHRLHRASKSQVIAALREKLEKSLKKLDHIVLYIGGESPPLIEEVACLTTLVPADRVTPVYCTCESDACERTLKRLHRFESDRWQSECGARKKMLLFFQAFAATGIVTGYRPPTYTSDRG